MYIRNLLKDLLVQTIDKIIRHKKASILMYHSVGNNKHFFTVTPENFEWQMGYLKRHNFNIISLGQLVEKIINKQPFQEKTIAITFDDGYADNYSNVFPVLKKYSIPITIFLPTDLVGQKQMVRGIDMEYLTWHQVVEMNQSGLVDFGSHSKTHRRLSTLGRDEVKSELKESKNVIEQNLNKNCDLFAYPFGDHNDGIPDEVKGLFKGAVSVIRGYIDGYSNNFLLPRQSIDSRVDKRRFKLKI